MSDTWQETGSTRTWDFASQIDEVCDLFEAAWKAGGRPRIEDYLENSPVPARVALLRELIPLDMEYRKRAGETVTEDDYRTRFPSWSAEESALGPGSTVPLKAGRFQLGDKIGEGGMGEVHRVQDPDFNRSLAIKVLLERHRGRADLEARFLEEAQILGQLQHPGIVPVHEIGRLDDGRPFFTMKLVKGQTLEKLLQDRPRPDHDLPRFLAIFEQICQTMANAHAHGVIHRDLKPSNVMVGAFGEVQVMDWGLAKVLKPTRKEPASPDSALEEKSRIATIRSETHGQSTRAECRLGSLQFMPPEQALGQVDRHDERSDVFTLGGILCVILTGHAPYEGTAGFRAQEEGELQPAYDRLAACGADRELIDLAKACLTADQEARPQNAGVVAERVAGYQAAVRERLQRAELDKAKAEVRAKEERKRRRLAVGLAAAVLLSFLLGGGGLGWWLWQQELKRHDVEPLLAAAEEILREPDRDPRQAEHLLDQAEARMAGGGPADLRKSLIAMARNLEMAKRLEAASLRPASIAAGKIDYRGGDRAYAAAFADFGLDMASASEEQASHVIRASPIANRLITALDYWAFCKDQITPKGGAELRTLADLLDHDAWRQRLRSALRTASLSEFEKLAGDESSLTQSTKNQTLLGWALFVLRDFTAAESWLRKANERHPQDFSINLQLAQTLRVKVPPDCDEALRFSQASLALQPDNALVFTYRGNIWYAKKVHDRAISDFDEAIRLDPTFAPAFNNRGLVWLAKKDYERAIRDFDEAIRLDPDFALAFSNRGLVWHAEKEYDRAIGDFDEAVRLDPNNALTFSARGNTWCKIKDYDRAMVDFDEAVRLDPNNATVFHDRGLAWAENKDYGRAIHDFNDAIRLDPNFVAAFGNRGLAWHSKKDDDRAIRDYDEVVRLDPNDANAFYDRGNAWREKKENDRAIGDYNEAIRLDPKLAGAFSNRGVAWAEKRDYNRAINDFDEAIRLDPNLAAAFGNRGKAWSAKKKYDHAIRDFDEALRLDPNNAKFFYNRGNVWRQRKDCDQAIRDFNEAIRLDPNYAEVFNDRGLAWVEKKHYDQAIHDFDAAIRLDPNDTIALTNRGQANLLLKRLANAEADLRKTVELSPNDLQAWVLLGASLADQGQFTEARNAFRTGLKLAPERSAQHNAIVQKLQMCERLIVLDRTLSGILQGENPPPDTKERVILAEFCVRFKQLNAFAVHLYSETFYGDSSVADDILNGQRYNAACAAALASCGQGKDANTLDDKDCPRLRKQALDWLRADLALWAKQAERRNADERALVVQTLKHWLEDADLAGVRDKSALEKLPHTERAAWEKLWADVSNVLNKVQEQK
jgi:tetratricopeptide (TPR) repeat protein